MRYLPFLFLVGCTLSYNDIYGVDAGTDVSIEGAVKDVSEEDEHVSKNTGSEDTASEDTSFDIASEDTSFEAGPFDCHAPVTSIETMVNGIRTPGMVRIVTSKQSFSIDKTEVTADQYSSWLSTNPSLSLVPECPGLASYAAECDFGDGSVGSQPIFCVSWCSAKAYCLSVGKRLCGAEWILACTSDGKHVYPYGDAYVSGECLEGLTEPGEVASKSCCNIEGLPVYDMSGNVFEWTDLCVKGSDAGDSLKCSILGGAYYSDKDYLSCTQPEAGGPMGILMQYDFIGFRCCKD